MMNNESISAVVIEDETNNREYLQTMIMTHCPEVVLCGAAGSADEAIELIKNKRPELLFLDVKLIGSDAFNIIEAFPYEKFMIIYVTAHVEYAHQAIQLSQDRMVNYLIKPVKEQELKLSVNRALERRKDKNFIDLNVFKQLFTETLVEQKSPNIPIGIINEDRDTEFIQSSNIVYCEAEGARTTFFLLNGRTIFSTKALGVYDELLTQSDFFRISNSIIVNLHMIRIYKSSEAYLLLKNGAVVDISRRKKSDFEKKLKSMGFMA